MISQRSAASDHDGPAKAAEEDHLALRTRAVVLIVPLSFCFKPRTPP
jgi:hypothetical protein